MMNYPPQLSILTFVCLFAFIESKGYAQSSVVPTAMVVRGEVVSIAEELIPKVQGYLKDSPHILLNVESGSGQTLVENALLEAFGKAGFKIAVKSNGQMSTVLDILVLDQSVRFQPRTSGGFDRSTRTILEARLRLAGEGEVHYLGSFSRDLSDTVAQQDASALFGAAKGMDSENAPSFFEKIAGPVLMIAGVFVIVYLFFTVRS